MPSPLSIAAVACALASAAILVSFLVRRPRLDAGTKLWLLLGLGVFPIGAAGAANVKGYQSTQERTFCGSCHVMIPHASDSENPASLGLASRHARNAYFGHENCYACHADYEMFGTVLTKMGGMRHVWLYYTEYRSMPLEQAKREIHLRKPFPNSSCMECHSTKLQGFGSVPDHRSAMQDLRAGRVSCASPGCHGYAHPTTKDDAGALPAELRDAWLDGGAGAPDGGAP